MMMIIYHRWNNTNHFVRRSLYNYYYFFKLSSLIILLCCSCFIHGYVSLKTTTTIRTPHIRYYYHNHYDNRIYHDTIKQRHKDIRLHFTSSSSSPSLLYINHFQPTTKKHRRNNKLSRSNYYVNQRQRYRSNLVKLYFDWSYSISLLPQQQSTTYVLTRIIFLRALAFVHCIAFWIAYQQNKALIGDNGITPARIQLDNSQQYAIDKINQRRSKLRNNNTGILTQEKYDIPIPNFYNNINHVRTAFRRMMIRNISMLRSIPRILSRMIDSNKTLQRIREILWDRSDINNRPMTTLLWFASNRNQLDPWLDSIAFIGFITSLSILIVGTSNILMMFVLWICQRSLLTVGNVWYQYGWEVQLNELSFHSLFMLPLFNFNNYNYNSIPIIILWTIRWHIFRVMIGAGFIKFRAGDIKWKNLSTMYYFYQTQPIVNPLSYYFHYMPKLWHKFEVIINHIIECIIPWFLLLIYNPIQLIRTVGLLQIIFQLTLISSGNLSYINWLTIIPSLTCLDDQFIQHYVPSILWKTSTLYPSSSTVVGCSNSLPMTRQFINVMFLILVLYLSIPVVKNLLSDQQIMNQSYDPLRLINTYGAFGTVQEDRIELIISSSIDYNGPWKEYEFYVKPDNIYKRPIFISPYHHRIDWQMWVVSSLDRIENSPWLFTFLMKLLEEDPKIMNLIKYNPWKDSIDKPKYIKIDRYKYQFYSKSKTNNNSNTNINNNNETKNVMNYNFYNKNNNNNNNMMIIQKQNNSELGININEQVDDNHYLSKRIPYWDRIYMNRFYPKHGIASIESLKDEIVRYSNSK